MVKPFVINDRQCRWLVFSFAVLLFVFEIYVVKVDYSSYFIYLLDSETYFFSVVALLCILGSFYLFYRFILFTLSAFWPYKLISILVFTAALFVEYGYQKALGRFSDKFDIETAIASTAEQRTASIWMYLNLYALIPVAVLIILAVILRPEHIRRLKDFGIIAALLIVSFAIFPFIVSQKFPTFATDAFIRTNVDFLISGPIASGKWATKLTGAEIRRRSVARPNLPDNYHPDNNVIVVVDESVRGDHLSLNGYARETTPFLKQLSGMQVLHNWGIAASASTGSRFTFLALVTGLTPDDFPDRSEFKVDTFPTIFQYAQAMKYKTYFFDGQMRTYSNGVEDDKNYFDSWQGILDISEHRGFNPWDIDNVIAGDIKQIIYSSTGNFIFVLKHGSHIPYQANFPPDQEFWKPSYRTENKFEIPSGDELPKVVNAYDNSLKYNIDSFFTNLIDDYTKIPNNSVIIYTGDHGQTLFVNGRASHGGNTHEEATVPLFIIGSLDGKVDTAYKASHDNIFPTLLDLIRFPPELRDHSNVPSLLKAKATDSKPRYFNPDLGYKIPFD